VAKQLKGSEFIEVNFYKNLIKETEQAKAKVKELVDSLKSDIKHEGKAIKLIAPKTLTDIKEFNKEVAKAKASIRSLLKLQREESALSKR